MIGVGLMLSGSTVPVKYLAENFVFYIPFEILCHFYTKKRRVANRIKVTKQELENAPREV